MICCCCSLSLLLLLLYLCCFIHCLVIIVQLIFVVVSLLLSLDIPYLCCIHFIVYWFDYGTALFIFVLVCWYFIILTYYYYFKSTNLSRWNIFYLLIADCFTSLSVKRTPTDPSISLQILIIKFLQDNLSILIIRAYSFCLLCILLCVNGKKIKVKGKLKYWLLNRMEDKDMAKIVKLAIYILLVHGWYLCFSLFVLSH